jgi:hypothetical protein
LNITAISEAASAVNGSRVMGVTSHDGTVTAVITNYGLGTYRY